MSNEEMSLKDKVAVALLAAADSKHAITGTYSKWCSNDGSGLLGWGHARSGVKEIWSREVSVRSIAAKIKQAGRVRSLRIRKAEAESFRWEVDVKAGGHEAEMSYAFECPGDLGHYKAKLDASREAKAIDGATKPGKPKPKRRAGMRL